MNITLIILISLAAAAFGVWLYFYLRDLNEKQRIWRSLDANAGIGSTTMGTALALGQQNGTPFTEAKDSYAIVNEPYVNRLASGPLSHCELNSVDSDPVVITFIRRLLSIGRPSHISRLIMTVVVPSIKRMLRSWFIAEQSVKLFKRSKAKLNSTPTIAVKSNMLRIITSLLCLNVGDVFWRIAKAVRCSLYSIGIRTITAARLGFTLTKHRPGYIANISTVAPAFPLNCRISSGRVFQTAKYFQYQEPAISLTSHILKTNVPGINWAKRIGGWIDHRNIISITMMWHKWLSAMHPIGLDGYPGDA